MLKRLEIVGFKSFAKKTILDFSSSTTAIVGPNGSGKSNIAEAFRFALGEQSVKSMRGKRTEDLIWGGSQSIPRTNRASVTIVFDNSHRTFKIDFDEVTIERTIFRDGASEYNINGSRVRLRDIEELLAGANIGETGHHIISQGEADRILLASARERRIMLEDALGLKVYEFKKVESQRKLLKTSENIAQVQSLRRELAPHLHFLTNQVEKIERADALRAKFISLTQTYFAIEDAYLVSEKEYFVREREQVSKQLTLTVAELRTIEEQTTTDAKGHELLTIVRDAEEHYERLTNQHSALAREVGRVEGILVAMKERVTHLAREPYVKVPRDDLVTLATEVARQETDARTPEALHAALSAVATLIKRFVNQFIAPSDDMLIDEEESVYSIERERASLAEKDSALAAKLEAATAALVRARQALVAHDETRKEQQRRIFGLAETKAQGEAVLAQAKAHTQTLTQFTEMLDRDKTEALTLGGSAAVSYVPLNTAPQEARTVQEERRRILERLKIRLEEVGGTNEGVRREHKETVEREQFLIRELTDLEQSAAGLAALINDLDTELAKHFSDGLAKVNASFTEYFTLLFGGGNARLALEESESDERDNLEASDDIFTPDEPMGKTGVDISVSLPKKRIRSLMQLSGGERALTSIALIFAMSQVNPPPFLILDETDAALDEANSRRYGDMIENLAKLSQLIAITHNRETMSRAAILYGVTMGSDGISKLLSVKFDEAVAVAK